MSAKNNSVSHEEMKTALYGMGEKAKLASYRLASMSSAEKNICLNMMAEALEKSADEIIRENLKDLKEGEKNGLSKAMLDRLALSPEIFKSMADGLRDITLLDDPVGKCLSAWVRPNGLKIEKISVPIGVIAIVYESRPNVTADAAGLCLKAGNAVILRGGSEAFHSNMALAHCLNRAALAAGLPDGAVQLVPWTDRQAVGIMLKMNEYIDLVIPRGGEGLIRAVVEQSTIPVIKHYKGVCHLFVDEDCDMKMALEIIENAKCQRPGVCNALETLLIHEGVAGKFVPKLVETLRAKGVELRGDSRFCEIVPDAVAASEEDWSAEYLDLILSVAIVPSAEKAVEHINKYGTRHSDGIITKNNANAALFMNAVDAAVVYMNASTRFTDGGEFGMGAEIGISTDKLHARGPMGLPELCTYKYFVFGNGQIRK